jgi:hypothetical protein
MNTSQFKKLGFSWDNDDYLIGWAYTDDILLFSDSEENIMELVAVVNYFNFWSNIELNPKEWEMHKIGNDGYTEFKIEDQISHNVHSIDCSENGKVMRYLEPHWLWENYQKWNGGK